MNVKAIALFSGGLDSILAFKVIEEQGIDVIDTQAAFDSARDRGISLYHTDDTHWTSAAVQITADLICRRLAQAGYRPALERGWKP